MQERLQQDTGKKAPLKRSGFVIPAIDIIEGACVRLTHGDYGQKRIYNEKPLEVAKSFEDAGLERLHLVDLDGAKARTVMNWKVLEKIASKTSLIIDFGGGLTSEKDVAIVFDSGAALATVGSIAVKDEALFSQWLQRWGAEKFFLGADVKDEKITISGWTEQTDILLSDFIQQHMDKGLTQIFCTDVAKDGALAGPSLQLYETIVKTFPALHFVASGGVSSIEDVQKLKEIGCSGVIIGKAIYEGRIRLHELALLNNESC